MPTCVVHVDREAAAYCRNCGRAMCPECKQEVRGMIYCEECLVQRVAGAPPPYAAAPVAREGPSPGLALFLGMVPGVGAIYNAQYAKAFLHVVVFGLLISLADKGPGGFGPLFGMLAFAFWAYMVGEAYHTAKKRLQGQPVDEWSGLVPAGSRLHGAAGSVILIAVGVIFLLDTLNIVPLHQIVRYWPVVLIVAGVLMLYNRLGPRGGQRGPTDLDVGLGDRD